MSIIITNQGNKLLLECLFLGLILMTINIGITHTKQLAEPALGGEQIDEQSSPTMMRPKSDENKAQNIPINTHRVQEIQVPPLNNNSNSNNNKNLTQQQPQIQGAILRTSHSQQPRQSIALTSSSSAATTTAASNLLAVRQHWRQMEKSLGFTFESTGDQLKLQLKELLAAAASATNSSASTSSSSSSGSSVSSGCKLALIEVADKVRDGSLWANQMLDASAKLPSGLLDGTLTEMGNFDGCLSIKSSHPSSASSSSSSSSSGAIMIQGQYCTISIKPHLITRPRLHTACQRLPSLSATSSQSSDRGSLLKNNGSLFKWISQNSHQFYYASLRLGICTPQKCSRNDIQLLLNNFLNKYELVGQVKSCQVSSSSLIAASSTGTNNYSINIQQFDLSQRIIIFALLALVGLSVIGTLVDCLYSAPPKQDGRKQTNFQMEQQQHQQQQQRQKQQPKRWQYQVYNSLDKCPECAHSTLANNLALWTNSSGLIIGQTKEDPLLSCPKATTRQQVELLEYDCCHVPSHSSNFVHADDEADEDEIENENGNQETKDESWIVKLEQNQLQQSKRDNNSPHHHHHHQHHHQHHHHNQQQQQQQPEKSAIKRAETHQAPNSAPSILIRLMRCFSLKQNLKTISKQVQTATTTTTSNGSNSHSSETQMEDIKVIHGLRTLTMIWIIFGHTIGLVNPEMMNNLFALAQLSCSSRFLQAILNATLAVNTFFMISGVVTMVSLNRRCKSASKLMQSTKTTNSSSTAIATEKKLDDGDTHHHDGVMRYNQESKSRKYCGLSQKSGGGGGGGNLTSNCGSSTCGDGSSSQIEADSGEDFISIASSSHSSGVSSSRRCIHNSSNSNSNTTTETNQHRLEPANARGSRVRKENNQRSQIGTNILGLPSDFKPILWLLMRYLRLTPAYACVIGLSILMPALGDGPFWLETAGQLGSACKQNWHLNLLYLNNLFETDKLCLIHSWYLSNDWQFFLLTMALIGLAYKSRKLALLLAISLGLASMATTFAQTVVYEFPPTIVTTSPAVAERWQFIHQLYYKPWPHLNSYLIGLLAGYFIMRPSKTKSQAPRLPSSKWRLSCLGLLVACLAALLLSSIYPWNMGHRVDPILTGLHAATFRTLWSICCGWLLFVLARQPQLLLSKFLSWPGFQLTSRLTYCTYLIHPLIIYYHFGTLRERIDSSMYSQFNRFLATLAQSYLFALILSLFVESPSIQLQHLLASLSSSSSSSSQQIDESGKKISTDHRSSSSMKPQRRHLESLSSNSTADSWLVNGSSEGSARARAGSGGAKLATTTGVNNNNSPSIMMQHQTHPMMMMMDPSSNSSSQSLPPSTIDNSVDYNNSQPTNSALDAEFQKKLAQAISKGFRIRSRMANGRSTNYSLRPTSILKPPSNPAFHVEPTSLGLIQNPLQKLQLSQQQYLENNQSPMITNRRQMHSTESLATFQPNLQQSHLPPIIPGRPKQQQPLDNQQQHQHQHQQQHQRGRSSSDESAKSVVFDKQTKSSDEIDSHNNNNNNCNLDDLIQMRRKFLSQRSHSSNVHM